MWSCKLLLPHPLTLLNDFKIPVARLAWACLQVLQRLRGKNVDVEAEFQAIYNETREAASTRWPIMKILRLEACYVPHLVTSLVITAGQQLTGMNGILLGPFPSLPFAYSLKSCIWLPVPAY